jgi:hypothetical protein
MSRTVRLNMKYHGLRKKSPDAGEAQKWCTVAAVYLHRFYRGPAKDEAYCCVLLLAE